MTYNIPDELAPYLEYIPEEMLKDVITDALRALIFAEPETPSQTPQYDMSQVLEQLQGIIGGGKITPEVKTAIAAVEKSKDVTAIVVSTSSTEDVDEDLQQYVDNFAESLFK